jgi:NAD+ synthase
MDFGMMVEMIQINLGMTYVELENAMKNKDDSNHQKYLEIRKKNLHKMDPIPVCKFNES